MLGSKWTRKWKNGHTTLERALVRHVCVLVYCSFSIGRYWSSYENRKMSSGDAMLYFFLYLRFSSISLFLVFFYIGKVFKRKYKMLNNIEFNCLFSNLSVTNIHKSKIQYRSNRFRLETIALFRNGLIKCNSFKSVESFCSNSTILCIHRKICEFKW